jgi:redox-sensitive bicupin YhaK (pirin superfamily)/predicted CoA-binding protein
MSGDIEQVIEGRPRDLGGFKVERVLPAIKKRFVGPFVFFDHMGPEKSADMEVRPHPHLHLATVTYLLEGEVHHRDSLGSHQVIHPGAINWMTAGTGIVHSERTQRAMRMHGLQLWVGLPKAHEDSAPNFTHYPAEGMPTFTESSAQVRVLVGDAYGATSPVKTLSPMFYVDAKIDAGGRVAVPTGHVERAVYVVAGEVQVDGAKLGRGQLGLIAREARPAIEAPGGARVVMIGGEPLDGPRYRWGNFVSSSQDRILAAAHDWRAGKFPKVPGDETELIPAPPDDPRFAGMYHHPSDEQLRKILEDTNTIAMVGASSNPARPSHEIMERLLAAGYKVIPVNPNETEILGQRAVASLRDIKGPVDVVDVFRKAEDTPPIADDAAAIGAKVLWLQKGVANEDAAARAYANNMLVVMDTCMGATHRRLHIAPKSR